MKFHLPGGQDLKQQFLKQPARSREPGVSPASGGSEAACQ